MSAPCTSPVHIYTARFPFLPQKVDRRPEGGGAAGTKRERCFGVEAFWRQTGPQERRKLLRAPLAKMAEGGWAAGRVLAYKWGWRRAEGTLDLLLALGRTTGD